jgi:hypothetical protein
VREAPRIYSPQAQAGSVIRRFLYTIQLRVIPKGERTVIAFHQEHPPGAVEREERRAHYRRVLDELERMT